MKKRFVLTILFILIATCAIAQEFTFVEGLTNTNYHASVAYNAKNRVIVTVWEWVNDDNTFREIRMLVIKHTRKGKCAAKDMITISGDATSYYPHVSYNSQTKRFLVTWGCQPEGEGQEVQGLVLNAFGKKVGGIRTFFENSSFSYNIPCSVPLISSVHNNKNKGDFLVAALNNDKTDYPSLKQFNSKTGTFYEMDTTGWKYVNPHDMQVTDAGQILIFGSTKFPSRDMGILSFKLGDAKPSYYKIGTIGNFLYNIRLTRINASTYIANWTDLTDSAYVPYYRLVRSTGKPRTAVKTNKNDHNSSMGNFLMASDGFLYGASRDNLGSDTVLNVYKTNGKFKKEVNILPGAFTGSEDLHLVELDKLETILLIYKDFDTGWNIKGILYPLEK